jgi:hypothetical protein
MVKFKNIADTINFLHCAIGHPDTDIMVKVFETNHNIDDLNRTGKSFSASFSAGNLQDKHPPVVTIVSDTPHAAFELDYKGKWTDSTDRPIKTFQGHLYTFIAVDSGTGFTSLN